MFYLSIFFSQIGNELYALESPNCSDKPLLNSPPTSLPEGITKLETAFSSIGGEVFGQGKSSWFLLHSLRQTHD